MNVKRIVTEGYASNCYLISSGDKGAIVDPSAKIDDIKAALIDSGVSLKYILLTHGHYDHILALSEIRESFLCPVAVHKNDKSFLSDPSLSLFHMIGKQKTFEPAEIGLSDGDELSLGGEIIKVIHTPGHTSGSVCYVCGEKIITGDTLFDMSVGRWDFPTGDRKQLKDSVKRLTDNYPNSTIYPGHGDPAEMQKQIKYNPYTKGML